VETLAYIPHLVVILAAIAAIVWQAAHRSEREEEQTERERKEKEKCEEKLEHLRELIRAKEVRISELEIKLERYELRLMAAGINVSIGAGAHVGQVGAGKDIDQKESP
jgi:predicted RNase H-like nuclease (RuvC/YqgF family)